MKKTKQNKKQSTNSGRLYPWWANKSIVAGILFALAFLIYANSLSNGFVLDDSIIILKNQYTTKGFSGLGDIFSTDTFKGYYGEDMENIKITGGRYRPVSLAFFAIIYQVFGANSTVFHLWNVLMYAACCALLYLVLRKVFDVKFSGSLPALLALLAAILFTVHPVHTEVVNNIKSNDEIFVLLLSLLTLYFSLRYRESGKKILAVWSGVLLFIACFAKENAITFLAVIPFTFYLMGEKPSKRKKTPWLPLIASLSTAFVVYFIIRLSILGWSIGESPLDLINNPFIKMEGGQWVHCSFGERMAMTFYSLGKYLQLLVFPHPLTTDYYPRYVDVMTFSNPGAAISLLAYLALATFVVFKFVKKQATLTVYGVFFFLATISIVSNLVFPIGTNLAERFLFTPSVGFCVAIAGLFVSAFDEKNKLVKQIVLSIFGVVLALFAVKTITRNPDFKSNRTLHYKDIEVSGNSAKMQNAVGALLAEDALKSQTPQEKARLSGQAMEYLDKALAIHPTYLEAYYMRGNVNFMMEKFEEAVQDYRKCLTLNPNFKAAYGNYALALRETAKKWLQSGGDQKKAIEYLEESNRLYPNEQETLDLLNAAKANAGGQ